MINSHLKTVVRTSVGREMGWRSMVVVWGSVVMMRVNRSNRMRRSTRMERRTDCNWWRSSVIRQYDIIDLHIAMSINKLSSLQSYAILESSKEHSINANNKF